MKPTISPAIDIQVPYNIERLFYYLSDGRSDLVAGWMKAFESTGRVALPQRVLSEAKKHLAGVRVDQEETLELIRRGWTVHRYVVDPHTAVGVVGAEKACGAHLFGLEKAELEAPVLCLSTAHASKFEAVITKALGEEKEVPQAIRLLELPGIPYCATLITAAEATSFESTLRRDIHRLFTQSAIAHSKL